MTMRSGRDRTTTRPTRIPAGHIVLVAIADVAHYVTPGFGAGQGSLEARQLLPTFPDRVVPMLPEELSADLCSLKRRRGSRLPGRARMVFDAQGRKKSSHKFIRGVMRSAARLTYARAQGRVRRQAGCSEINATVVQKDAGRCLWSAYQGADHRAGKARALWIWTFPSGASSWAKTARSASYRLSRAAGIDEADRRMHGAWPMWLPPKRWKHARSTPLIYRIHDTSFEGKAVRLFRFPPHPEYQLRQGPGGAARRLQPRAGPGQGQRA